MEEGSELMLQTVNFRIDDKVIFTAEDSYELISRKPSEKDSLVFDNVKKTSSADEEDNQCLVVTERMLNTDENLQGNVSVENLKPETILKLSLE